MPTPAGIVRQGIECVDRRPDWADYRRRWSPGTVMLSPVVSEVVFNLRFAACQRCPHLQVWADGRVECVCCTCGSWALYRGGNDQLERIRHAGYACPRSEPAFDAALPAG